MADEEMPQKPPRPSRPKKNSTNDNKATCQMATESGAACNSQCVKDLIHNDSGIDCPNTSDNKKNMSVDNIENDTNFADLLESIVSSEIDPVTDEVISSNSTNGIGSDQQVELQADITVGVKLKMPDKSHCIINDEGSDYTSPKPAIKPKPQIMVSAIARQDSVPSNNHFKSAISTPTAKEAANSGGVIQGTCTRKNNLSSASYPEKSMNESDVLNLQSSRSECADDQMDTVKEPSSQQASVGVQSASLPIYAVVNRGVTRPALKSEADINCNRIPMVETLSPSGSAVSSPTRGISESSAVPPKKPPRTFEHSEYLRMKKARDNGTSLVSGVTVTVPSAVTSNDYEEIGALRATLEQRQPAESCGTNPIRTGSQSEERADALKRRSTTDKLPAPPRPPPPVLNDVSKNATLPHGTILLSDVEVEADRSTHFVRNAHTIRTSERSYFAGRRPAPTNSTSPLVDGPSASRRTVCSIKENSDRDDAVNDLKSLNGRSVKARNKSQGSTAGLSDMDAADGYAAIEFGRASSQPQTESSGSSSPLPPSTNLSRSSSAVGHGSKATSSRSSANSATLPVGARLLASIKNHHSELGAGPYKHMQLAQSRVSNAYSILRLNMTPLDSDENIIVKTTTDEDSDEEVISEQQMRRLKHIATVRERTSQSVMQYAKCKEKEPDRSFDTAVIVGLKIDENKKCRSHIIFQCPLEQVVQCGVESIEQYCFPDADIWRPVTIYDGEMTSFMLIDNLGVRRYGYCQRYLPAGSSNRLPEAYCVVSRVADPTHYEQLLSVAQERRKTSIHAVEEFFEASYATGSHPSCATAGLSGTRRDVSTQLPGTLGRKNAAKTLRLGEQKADNVYIEVLISLLPSAVLVNVFEAMLLERRIIFCAQKLYTLTSCVHALTAILDPFEWQHILIAVLPLSMIQVLDLRTPFMIGILASTYSKLIEMSKRDDGFDFNEILIVDLDGGSLLRCYGDEGETIPKKLQKALMSSLSDDIADAGYGMREMVLREAFLRFFIETCGHYTEYICTQQDGQGVFERESFIKAVTSHSIQMFLEWFTLSQMFDMFIMDELHGAKHGAFETRILEYREEMAELSSSLKRGARLVGQKIKDFFVESGDKLKKTFQRTVYV